MFYILFIIIMVIVAPPPPPQLQMEGGGGLWHWGDGGEFIQKEFWCNKRYLTKLPTFNPMSQKYSASIFQVWHKIHFFLHFHVCCFSNNKCEWIKLFMCYIYILSFKSKKKILILVFLRFEIINTEKVRLLFLCSAKKVFLKMAFCKAASSS